jgi:hypothetical protein
MTRAIIALLASVLTAVQGFFIYFKGQTICFTDGCAVVESLTTVPPLYFNIAGFLFFQTIFWCLIWGRDGAEHWHKLARLLLLAALCAEAVLVFFQYAIVTVFCSYCLVIFGLIVLLNILSGARQIFRGIVLFSAIILVFFSLQFGEATGRGESLDGGSVATVSGDQQERKLYLFFSSTCAHCEKVIELLQQENSCNIGFNPIERLDNFDFPGAKFFADYNPEINLNFMKSLALKEIPVLVGIEPQGISVLRGELQIRRYVEDKCRKTGEADYSGSSSAVLPGHIYPGAEKVQDDACQVATECDPEVVEEAAAKK